MKKKVLAIFATALLLALCAFPCFAYPSQNLTFGGFYQNEDTTPYTVQEFRGDITAEASTWIFRAVDLSREIGGFILEVEIPFLNGYGGDCYLSFEQWYSPTYSNVDTLRTTAYSDYSSVFYFVVPRRGVDSLNLALILESDYTFAPEDASIVCTLYPISLDTSALETESYNEGYSVGFPRGQADGQSTTQTLDTFLERIFAALATFFAPFMTFEIWGINVMGVLSLVVIATIAVIIFKMKS